MNEQTALEEIQSELNRRGLGDSFAVRSPGAGADATTNLERVVLTRTSDRRTVDVPIQAAFETLRQNERWDPEDFWEAFNRQGYVL